MQRRAAAGPLLRLVLFFIGAMVGLVLTGSLLLVFVFWEITALCSYALISFHNDDPKAVAGGDQGPDHHPAGRHRPAGRRPARSIVYLGSYEITDVPGRQPTACPPAILALMAFGFLVAAGGQIGPVPLPDLAAGRDGSADARSAP